ncbi:hypothetical protein GA0070608_2067 [Micromonospora peucetia]|uniref:Uncharacterized protein n=1 Tax=Micromonospora peucetia TaxID=47871 RepID=A0A1C6UYP2_9ACTN|nr:hypothetical protein GA0070608_2067 [Micromonospora peucetia]
MPPTPSRHDAPARPPGPAEPGVGRSRARTDPPPGPHRPITGPARPATPSYARRLAVVVLLGALPLAGCGTPPELRRPAPTAAPTRTAAPGTPSAAPTPPPDTGLPDTGLPTPTVDPGLVAVPCPDGPSGARIVDLVRGRGGVLPTGVRVRVRTGPLCAGDWHYTVLDVTGHETLQVVTEGRPGAPRLVTAGTDVCTAEVRAAGPPGIRTRVCDTGGLDVPVA